MKPNIDDLRFAISETGEAYQKAKNDFTDFLSAECKKYNIECNGIKIVKDRHYRDEIEMKLRSAYDDEAIREQADAKYHEMKEGL